MMPRTTNLPSDLTDTQALPLGRIITSKGAPATALVGVAPATPAADAADDDGFCVAALALSPRVGAVRGADTAELGGGDSIAPDAAACVTEFLATAAAALDDCDVVSPEGTAEAWSRCRS